MDKIVLINRYFYPDHSATSQMASDLAFSLSRAGNQVSIITSRQTYEDSRASLPRQENINDVDIRRVWTTHFGRTNLAGRAIDYVTYYLSAFIAMLQIISRRDIVIVKTDPPLISVVAWVAAGIKGARLVNWLQDVFPEVAVALGVLPWRPLVAPLRWLRNLSLRGATMNVAIGEIMQQRLLEIGILPDTVSVIQNWADGKLIRPVLGSKNILRKAWGLQDKFVVGYSGNMGRAHDFDTVIQAMIHLKDHNNIIFLFIGGGAGKQKLEQAFLEHGIINYRFMPYQEQQALTESLSVADVHLVSLLPQLEGLIVPSKIYGIAAAGRPVIFVGDPSGEIGKMIHTYGFGVNIPIGESEKMANAILKFMDDQDNMEIMGRSGRLCLENHFDKPCAINKWQTLLDQL